MRERIKRGLSVALEAAQTIFAKALDSWKRANPLQRLSILVGVPVIVAGVFLSPLPTFIGELLLVSGLVLTVCMPLALRKHIFKAVWGFVVEAIRETFDIAKSIARRARTFYETNF